MSNFDWMVLLGTLLLIALYGMWKTRRNADIDSHLLSGRSMRWWVVLLSIMATQASAITFLSTPGQAFDEDMRFVQFYFGLPIAMVIIAAVMAPIYYRLKVYTPYEYLEQRFDLKTRQLGSLLFLIQRSLAAGITIYAPAIILSTILGWNIYLTILLSGFVVILYTVTGGARAVAVTHVLQMGVIIVGMIAAGVLMVLRMPSDISFGDALSLAGTMGKLDTISWEFNLTDKYTIWSGIIGGTFLALAYFGTDHSQVQRYLGGKSLRATRLGLLMNGLVKVPMQFLILLLGAMMFVFYQFPQSGNDTPLLFNPSARTALLSSDYQAAYMSLEKDADSVREAISEKSRELLAAKKSGDKVLAIYRAEELDSLKTYYQGTLQQEALALVKRVDPAENRQDHDYTFLHFVLSYLPKGMIGLLLAVIFCAAMSSSSSEITSLSATTVVDIYRRSVIKEASEAHYVKASRFFTALWGLIAIGFAFLAYNIDNLIELVNYVGSLFYGTVLGIFIAAFFVKRVSGTPVFVAALLAQMAVLALDMLPRVNPEQFAAFDISYLWYNVVGCLLVVLLALVLQPLLGKGVTPKAVEMPDMPEGEVAERPARKTKAEKAPKAQKPAAPRKAASAKTPAKQLTPAQEASLANVRNALKQHLDPMVAELRHYTPLREPSTWTRDGEETTSLRLLVNPETYAVSLQPLSETSNVLEDIPMIPAAGALLSAGDHTLTEGMVNMDDKADAAAFRAYEAELRKLYMSWLSFCWDDAGGRAAGFPAAAQFDGDSQAFDLKKKRWMDAGA